jgi:hypothetical protein
LLLFCFTLGCHQFLFFAVGYHHLAHITNLPASHGDVRNNDSAAAPAADDHISPHRAPDFWDLNMTQPFRSLASIS